MEKWAQEYLHAHTHTHTHTTLYILEKSERALARAQEYLQGFQMLCAPYAGAPAFKTDIHEFPLSLGFGEDIDGHGQGAALCIDV